MFSSIKKQLKLVGVLLGVVAICASLSSLAFHSSTTDAFRSVEVAVAELSPEGVEGGVVVPASCPSYSHSGGDCNAEEGDMCFNIAGWQGGWGEGFLETPGVYRNCCYPPTVPTTYTCEQPCTVQAAQTQTLSCPSGQSGSISQQRSSYCTGAYYWNLAWTGWNTTSNTCSPNCSPEATQTQTLSCQAGYSGSITQQRTSSCPAQTGSPVWSGWSTTANTCAPTCTPSTQTQTLSCPAGQNGSITQSRTSSCPGPTWPGWTTTGNTCAWDYSVINNPTVTATPTTVGVGETTVIGWSCDTAHGETSSSGIGLSTGGGTSGSVTVYPTQPSNTYGVQCNPSTRQTTTTVTIAGPTLTISASPARVNSGSASTISWRATSVNSCTLTGTGINTSCSGASCGNAHTNSTGALSTQSVYTLSCTAPSGTHSASATVFITPSVCEVGGTGCPNP